MGHSLIITACLWAALFVPVPASAEWLAFCADETAERRRRTWDPNLGALGDSVSGNVSTTPMRLIGFLISLGWYVAVVEVGGKTTLLQPGQRGLTLTPPASHAQSTG